MNFFLPCSEEAMGSKTIFGFEYAEIGKGKRGRRSNDKGFNVSW